MQARPKLYALLLGSGVSRAAGILTGWEVVLDLVRKLMVMRGVDPTDPHSWYREEYGTDPDYSALIERVAPTSAERQQVLRQYWEADSTDDSEASKRPTAAHRAIADLAKGGFVKVILTTNFDRLVENALREAGVEPAVLSSSDDIVGMMPLDHTDCCVVKLHGDYLDERIRNTTDELSEYPNALDDLLDRILEEYGLVVCGWSGEWDVALGKAIRRAKSRRYTTYWTAYGALGDEARRIAEAREARVIEIEGAESFFEGLSALVRSVEEHATTNPLSVQATIAQCKRFLAHDEHRIRLADLIDTTGKEAFDGLAALPSLNEFDAASLTGHLRRCEGVCSKLLSTAVVSSYWGRETQVDAWRRTLEMFFQDAPVSGNESTIAVRSYPVVLLTYALGIGAVASGQLANLGKALNFPTGRDAEVWLQQTATTREEDVAQGLSRTMLSFARSNEYIQNLEGMRNRYVPMNDWLWQSLRGHTRDVIPSDTRYERVFDKVEVMLSLSCGLRMDEVPGYIRWFPIGCFLYRSSGYEATIQEIEESLNREGDNSLFVRHSIVGRNATDGAVYLQSFRDCVERSRNESGIFF